MTYMGRKNIMRNARLRRIFDPSCLFDAERRCLPCDLWPFKGHVGIACCMQCDRVGAISGILGSLQPVTMFNISAHDPTTVVSHQKIIAWQERRRLGTNIGKDQPAGILRIIGGMLYSIFARAAARLRWLFKTIAASVVKPTVITAGDAFLLDPSIFEGSAAMRTMERHEPEPLRPIAEQYEFFTQQFDL